MKKLMILAAAMCCMVSASAQTMKHELSVHKSLKDKAQQAEKWNRYENTFSEKLDSICTDFEKAFLSYDERFNCVKVEYWSNWMGWIQDYTEEYTYDEQDRVVTLTMTSSGYGDRSEYTYNAEGLLSEELEYEYDGTGWYLANKYTYEYDSDGHIVLSVGYWYFQYEEEWLPESKMTWEYEGGLLRSDVFYYYDEGLQDWSLNMRNDYTYNTQGLCILTLTSYWEGEWLEGYKYEYEYDEVGNRILAITSCHYDLEGWTYSERTEYSYDINRNCIGRSIYTYIPEMEEWEFGGITVIVYDLSVPVSNTAGIFMVWDDELSIYNKALGWQLEFEDETMTVDLYYSGCVGLNETSENQVNIWPNPASETLNLNAEGLQQVEIFSMDGKLVKRVENGFETVNVSALSTGCYMLKATFTNGSMAVQKFVKE